jgi:phage terminase small subunit
VPKPKPKPRAKKAKAAPKKAAAKPVRRQVVPVFEPVLEGELIPANMDPLEYMLKVMNDPGADKDRRDRMAVAAAPFVHGRKAPVGAKEQKAAAAAAARGAGNPFAAPAPPPRRTN